MRPARPNLRIQDKNNAYAGGRRHVLRVNRMFIVSRLTSRSSLALSVSVDYAHVGGGCAAPSRARNPDDSRRKLGSDLIPVRTPSYESLTGSRLARSFQAVFSGIIPGRFLRHMHVSLGPQARGFGLVDCCAAMKESFHE